MFAAYPAGVRFDRASETWIVVPRGTGPYVPLGVSVWDRAGAAASPGCLRDRYVARGGAGRPGAPLSGPGSLPAVPQGTLWPGRHRPAAAPGSGPGDRRSCRVPSRSGCSPSSRTSTEVGTRPGAGGQRSQAPGRHRFTTALVPGDGELLLDPAAAGGALIAVGTSPGADLALGPSSLGNEDLVLVYEAILAQKPAPFLTRAPRGPLRPVGTAFLTEQGTPLLPPPSQFFETRSAPRLVLPPPSSWRWPWVAAAGQPGGPEARALVAALGQVPAGPD